MRTVLQFAAALFSRLCAGLRTPHRASTAGLLVSLSPLLLVSPTPAHADIYQWEYINSADPSQGKRQSTTLAPDGAGVDAVPGADLSGRDLTTAHLIGADLTNAVAGYANLTNADLSQAMLTQAYFDHATLTGADFTGTNVRGASFRTDLGGTGIRLVQLYSTANYQTQDLSGINLRANNLAGGNFIGQDLTNAIFVEAILTGANFAGAEVRGGEFSYSDITPAQLYATASYVNYDLSGIGLGGNDLSDADLAGQNLRNADFGAANLSGANFREANLTNVDFDGRFYFCYLGCGFVGNFATLTGANLTSVDVRGANGFGFSNLGGATTANLIWPDGHIKGLDLDARDLLVVHDYDGNPNAIDDYGFPSPIPPIPITIDQRLSMTTDGTLRTVFEADAWDSTISFAAGIPVTLGGTLELAFAADVNPASQVGRTFDLFDWTGVSPTGTFAVSSPYRWDLSHLYTTGEVTLTAIPEPSDSLCIGICLATLALTGRISLASHHTS